MRVWARWRRWWLLPRAYARSLLAAFALLTAYFVPAISVPGCGAPGARPRPAVTLSRDAEP